MSTIIADDDRQEESSGYSSKSAELLLNWQNMGSPAKSNNEINHLLYHTLYHPDFQLGRVRCEAQKPQS